MTTEIKQLAIRLCRAIENNYAIGGEYHAKKVESGGYQLQVEEGRKYYKLVVVNGQTSVHAFVDKLTGDLYMPETWNKPAKHVRFNLVKDIEKLEEKAKSDNSMWAGGYLYMR